MYTFNFQPDNGYRGNDISELLMVATPPVIPFPQELLQSMQLGDGTAVYRHTGVYQDIIIQIECNFVVEKREQFLPAKSLIDSYFGDRQGKLSLCEDNNHYWKVKDITIKEGARTLGRASDVTLNFTCEPYRYFTEYSEPQSFVSGEKSIFNNPYAPATPVYKIYNDSENATRLWILNNGNQLEIYNPFTPEGDKKVSYIEISTQWNYMKAVFSDDSYEYRTIDTRGSFADIRFDTGVNEVEVGIDIGAVRVEVERGYKER